MAVDTRDDRCAHAVLLSQKCMPCETAITGPAVWEAFERAEAEIQRDKEAILSGEKTTAATEEEREWIAAGMSQALLLLRRVKYREKRQRAEAQS